MTSSAGGQMIQSRGFKISEFRNCFRNSYLCGHCPLSVLGGKSEVKLKVFRKYLLFGTYLGGVIVLMAIYMCVYICKAVLNVSL